MDPSASVLASPSRAPCLCPARFVRGGSGHFAGIINSPLADGTAEVTARPLGDGQLEVIEDAPGSEVKLRLDQKKA